VKGSTASRCTHSHTIHHISVGIKRWRLRSRCRGRGRGRWSGGLCLFACRFGVWRLHKRVIQYHKLSAFDFAQSRGRGRGGRQQLIPLVQHHTAACEARHHPPATPRRLHLRSGAHRLQSGDESGRREGVCGGGFEGAGGIGVGGGCRRGGGGRGRGREKRRGRGRRG
jgi:hypothetical protein